MSDYRLNSENKDTLNESSYQGDCGEHSRSFNQIHNNSNLLNSEFGISSQEKSFNPKGRSKISHEQMRMFRPSSPETGRNNIDVSYIGEVERISSSLIKLLWQSRQNNVNAANGVSKRLHLLQGIVPKAESKEAFRYQTDRHLMHSGNHMPESTRNAMPEHTHHMPSGLCDSSNKTAPISVDRLFFPTDEDRDINGISENGQCEIGAKGSRLLKEEDLQVKNTCREFDRRGSLRDNSRAGIKGMLAEDIDRLEHQRQRSREMVYIDMVKGLRNTQEHIRQLEYKLRERDIQIRLLALRIERLEFINAGNNAILRDIDVVQKGVSPKDQHVNSDSAVFSVCEGKKPQCDMTLTKPTPGNRKRVTLPLNKNEEDETSSTSSDESAAMSSPGCHEKDNNNMDCNN